MKNTFFLLITSIFFCLPLQTFSEYNVLEFKVLEDEQWWAGAVAQSHLMPIHEQRFEFDFFGNIAGNQGQPLLLSNKGRYVWSEDPFKFQFSNKVLKVESPFGSLQSGNHGQNLAQVYKYVNNRYFPASGKIPAPELFLKPQFNTWIEFTYNQYQQGILDYAHKIVENGFEPGVLMIDEGWFKTYGDWEFEPTRFPDPKSMMTELHQLGFKVILWICPYITSDGQYWKTLWLDYKAKKDTIWIVNAENPDYPAVMQWWNGFSHAVDLSHPDGRAWFTGKLDYLVETYGIDGFKFDGGDAKHYTAERFLSPTLSFQKDIIPNQHSELFVKVGLDYPYNEYRAAWKMGGQPIAMRLRDKSHNWQDLHKLIPGIVNQGLMGYPFTCPDMIGGGEYLSFMDLEQIDQELVVRAAQCHALMPMMQFSVAPWRILSKENLQICVEMANLHTDMGAEILACAKESAKSGEPIVRSMDYVFPNRGYDRITDQFMLGSFILVAPVLEKGARSRIVYLPEGKWKGDDGSIVKGPAKIEIDAPLTRLPWYRKL